MTADAGAGAAESPARLRRLLGRTPLRVKLVAALVSLVALALAGAGLATITALRKYEMSRIDLELSTLAAGPGADGGPAAGPDGPIRDDRGRQGRRGRRGGAEIARAGRLGDHFVAVVAPSGTVRDLSLATRSEPETPELPDLTAESPYLVAEGSLTVSSFEPNGPRWRVRVVPARDGVPAFVVASSLRDVDRTLRQLTRLQLGIGLGALVLLGAIGYVVVRNSLRPLVEVEATAEAIAAGDLSRRVPERDRRTEVGRLSASLNGMLAQIETAFRSRAQSEAAARLSEDRMRRFVTDASHELRTPLTSIRGFAELYRQGAVAEPEATSRLMRRIEDEAARMGLLVDDLLLLARLDQQRPLERRPVDLLALAADAVHDARAVAPRRPIHLALSDGPVPPVVLGDELRLRQVLGNLVSNALTHTPDDTAVTVAVRTDTGQDQGHRVVVEVRDNGPGLAPEDAERVFERFYRADSSRTRASGGSGLGLSIVAALVAAHGGTVEVDSASGAGTTFRLVLPAGEVPVDPRGSAAPHLGQAPGAR